MPRETDAPADRRLRANPPERGRVTHREVLAISLPIIVSNITEPLIGIVDTAVLGQFDTPHLIGAVALGATIFSLVFFGFSFLKMGTSGITAQADGAGDQDTVAATIVQSCGIAVIIGLILILLTQPIAWLAFSLLQGSREVEAAASTYLHIRIWSAPFALLNFAVFGWFIGLRRARMAFLLQLLLNGLNIVFDLLLVLGFGLGIAGVAYGTLAAEVIAAIAGALIIRHELQRSGFAITRSQILDRRKLVRLFAVNRDIMIRTVVLVFAFAFFVNQGARGGDIILAANALLFHLVGVTAYVLDGFAYAAESLVGHAVGARNKARFRQAVRISTLWAGLLSVLISALIWIAGYAFIDAMTVSEAVRSTARTYLVWAALSPVAGFACFQLDGIFIGATRTADMRNMVIVSVIIYLGAWWVLAGAFANHGLWASLLVLFAARAITLGWRYPALLRSTFPESLRP